MKTHRGEVITIVLIVLALIGGGLFVIRPKWLHGETKRAEASKTATAKVEAAVTTVDDKAAQQAAHAAAQVATIGRANALSPDSPAKDFIAQEVPATLANLPKPDPEALLEAEKRRSAVMEGRAAEARQLYEREATKSASLQHERDAALAARDAAMVARRQVDGKLLEAAAEHLADERRTSIAIVVAVLAGALWLYTKLTHLSPSGIGNLAKDIRAGFDPIDALSIHTPPWIHAQVQKVVKLAANLDQPPAKP